MEFLFLIVILIFSVVIHEVSHGVAANYLGDPTAKYAGRLTLNPIKHLDPFGSVLLPLLLLLFRSPILFAWAKPVPFNPYNLRDQKWGPAKIAIAGPASNFLIALGFGILGRFLPLASDIKSGIIFAFFSGQKEALSSLLQTSFVAPIFLMFSFIVFLNTLLAIFNLVPIPPLDGSKILYSFLPYRLQHIKFYLETYGPFIIIFFLFLVISGAIPLFSIIFAIFRLIIGV